MPRGRTAGRMFARFGALLRSFGRARSGAAVVEFALIMPLLLMLYFGSVEASSLYTVDRRVTIVSGTIGDLVAQWNPDGGAISQATINDYFDAAQTIMTPYDATGLAQVVSFVAVNASGVTKVLWSKATGGGQARATGSSFPLDAGSQMNVIARNGGFFVASEASISYTPVLGLVFQNALLLSHTSYFLPRFAECIQVSGSACS